MISICGHYYCSGPTCYFDPLEGEMECGAKACKQQLSWSTVYNLRDILGSKADELCVEDFELLGFETHGPSPKIHAVLSYLNDLRAKRSTDKTLVFSQWTSLLDLLEEPLKIANFQYTRVDGSMSMEKRDKNLKEFADSPKVFSQPSKYATLVYVSFFHYYSIMPNYTFFFTLFQIQVALLSLKACNTGLNITAANHVLFTDIWWNPTAEDQAVDRTHRLGQTKEVWVTHFIMQNTIEETLWQVQQTKRTLINECLNGTLTKATKKKPGHKTVLQEVFREERLRLSKHLGTGRV